VSTKPVIIWFNGDLRLSDNPALTAAVATGRPVLPIYVHDDISPGDFDMGAASRWWLHQSLVQLDQSLDRHLHLARGAAASLVVDLAARTAAHGVYWNRGYEPWRIKRDRRIKTELRNLGIVASSFGGSLLFEPQSVTKADGTPYRVFTPFYRKGCLERMPEPRRPLPPPENVTWLGVPGDPLESLQLMPSVNWYEEIAAEWSPGEAGAGRRLTSFILNGITHYKEGRNRPDQAYVSRLSPHLHFGELSPNQAWYAAAESGAPADDIDHFQSELGWREFSHHLLYHNPELPTANLQRKFDRFPWREDADALARWQSGRTGYPIVDAGMRELWQTGYMHNRVRMIVGSFLVKNLLLDWRHGEAWFRDTLLDADLANNSASWQWIAGCGADAAPYFRVFNPVTQSVKFDPDGTYVRRYVPELAQLPTRHLHAPWNAPPEILADAGIRLGDDYPAPVVDLVESRERALAAFHSLGK
jgi:deoxyribodipyrimidine photo-lyase